MVEYRVASTEERDICYGIVLSPLRGSAPFPFFHPRLAPWAAFFRRFAAGQPRAAVPTKISFASPVVVRLTAHFPWDFSLQRNLGTRHSGLVTQPLWRMCMTSPSCTM